MRFLLVGTLCCAISISAHAEESSRYFAEVSVGETEYPWQYNQFTEYLGDDEVTSWSLGVGGEINENLSLMLSYIYLGEHEKKLRSKSAPYNTGPYAEAISEISSYSLAVSPNINITKSTLLFAELGRHWWDGEGSLKATVYQGGVFTGFKNYNSDTSGNDNFWAVGLGYELSQKYYLKFRYADYEIESESFKNYSVVAGRHF